MAEDTNVWILVNHCLIMGMFWKSQPHKYAGASMATMPAILIGEANQRVAMTSKPRANGHATITQSC